MSIVYDRDRVTVHHADALDVLRTMPDCSVQAVVCDPQYGLSQVSPSATIAAVTAWVSGDRGRVPDGRGFMGAGWDSFVPPPAIWDECRRVLTPGGHLLVFAGTRMADLAGLSIRLAEFEIRDEIDVIGSRISWLYGTGMPKSRTGLKPAHEPILVARKPCAGSEMAAVQRHGTGGLNIDACRTAVTDSRRNKGTGMGFHGGDAKRGGWTGETGRWPSNVVLVHAPLYDSETGEVIGDACADGCVPGCPVADLDRQSGVTPSNFRKNKGLRHGAIYGGGKGPTGPAGPRGHGDTGGASRFFHLFRWEPKAPRSERPTVGGVSHPTVKPLALMRWLVRLVTPPGGTVLDPFAGSGTTGQAARAEGFRAVLVERQAEYIPHIVTRLGGHTTGDLFAPDGGDAA